MVQEIQQKAKAGGTLGRAEKEREEQARKGTWAGIDKTDEDDNRGACERV